MVTPAASDTTKAPGLSSSAISSTTPKMILRLDDQHDDIGLPGGLHVGGDVDAVALMEFDDPVVAFIGDHERVPHPITAQQPRQQCLTHDAGPYDRNYTHVRNRNNARLPGAGGVHGPVECGDTVDCGPFAPVCATDNALHG
ncbi:MAG: hypothetical protein V9G09_16850 [Candidatus Nanopelagicales bacterium]